MDITEALLLAKEQKQNHIALRADLNRDFPTMMRALKIIDLDYSEAKKHKGYNLVKRENKKLGYVYYVRYSHKGKMLPTKWNTHTNLHSEAVKFAVENKERLVENYLREHDTKAYELFEKFYASGSPYLASEKMRNRPLAPSVQRRYFYVITKKYIPYLKEQKIVAYEGVTVKVLNDFQDSLLASGIKPQSVNDSFSALKRIYAYMERKELIGVNPCRNLSAIPVQKGDRKARGCLEIEKIKGIFNTNWQDKTEYMLALLVYTMGMRNSEIKRINMKDIIKIENCRFIDVKKSKTSNGIRLIPLHDFVYKKLAAYAAEKDLPFTDVPNRYFTLANIELGRRLKLDEEKLKEENITYYSGRHFWKTMMNCEGLGDSVEELFMGHKVSADVGKLYNHRDKVGKKNIANKARLMFSILDRCIFAKL